MIALETNYLVPTPGFVVGCVLFVLGVLLLVVLPLVRAIKKDHWVWALLTVFFPPLGGALYLATADRSA